MRKKITSLMMFSILILVNCYTMSEQNLQMRISQENAKIFAVLDFDFEGFMSDNTLADFAANELSANLFIHKGYKIIDRSLVRRFCKNHKILIKQLNLTEIRMLSEGLNVDYLVLGNIQSLENNIVDIDPQEKKYANIQIRILHGRTGDVVGFLEHKLGYYESIKLSLEKEMKKISMSFKI